MYSIRNILHASKWIYTRLFCRCPKCTRTHTHVRRARSSKAFIHLYRTKQINEALFLPSHALLCGFQQAEPVWNHDTSLWANFSKLFSQRFFSVGTLLAAETRPVYEFHFQSSNERKVLQGRTRRCRSVNPLIDVQVPQIIRVKLEWSFKRIEMVTISDEASLTPSKDWLPFVSIAMTSYRTPNWIEFVYVFVLYAQRTESFYLWRLLSFSTLSLVLSEWNYNETFIMTQTHTQTRIVEHISLLYN